MKSLSKLYPVFVFLLVGIAILYQSKPPQAKVDPSRMPLQMKDTPSQNQQLRVFKDHTPTKRHSVRVFILRKHANAQRI